MSNKRSFNGADVALPLSLYFPFLTIDVSYTSNKNLGHRNETPDWNIGLEHLAGTPNRRKGYPYLVLQDTIHRLRLGLVIAICLINSFDDKQINLDDQFLSTQQKTMHLVTVRT